MDLRPKMGFVVGGGLTGGVDLRHGRRGVSSSVARRRPWLPVRMSGGAAGGGSNKGDGVGGSAAEPGSTFDEAYWAELADEVYGESPAPEPEERPKPKFVYPDGLDESSFMLSEEDASAWESWNAARENDKPGDPSEISPRDPKKETAFWKSTARELVEVGGEGKGSDADISTSVPVTSSSSSSETPSAETVDKTPFETEKNYRDLFGFARGALNNFLTSVQGTSEQPASAVDSAPAASIDAGKTDNGTTDAGTADEESESPAWSEGFDRTQKSPPSYLQLDQDDEADTAYRSSGGDVSLGDSSYWASLARDLGAPASEEKSAQTAEASSTQSKWVYPDGISPDDFKNNDSSAADAWDTWNKALIKEAQTELQERDPQKEKDFWRGAAKQMSEQQPLNFSEPTSAEEDQPPLPTPPRDDIRKSMDRGDIWSAARSIASETQAFQEQLKEEVENYDPMEEKGPYSDIAKDLLADLRAREVETEQLDPTLRQVGTNEWDPDRDWRRFDDVGAELARQRQALESSSRWREELMDASEATYDDLSSAPDENLGSSEASGNTAGGAAPTGPIRYTDESGRVLSREEVERLASEGAVFVDETGDTVDMSDGLLNGGQPAWGSADMELPDIPSSSTPRTMPGRRFSSSTYGGNRGGIARDLEQLKLEGLELRDPKADTNFWRSAAQELSSDGSSENQTSPATPSSSVPRSSSSSAAEAANITESDPNSEDAASAWSSWTSASKSWEKALETAEQRDPKKEVDMWRGAAQELTGSAAAASVDKSDWGSGFEKASTESAWESWRDLNPVPSGSKDGWWDNRADNVSGRKEQLQSPRSTSSDPSFWSGIAKDVTKAAESSTQSGNAGAGGRELGESINQWLDFAKTVERPAEGSETSGGDDSGQQ